MITRTPGISKSMLSMSLKELNAKRIISGSREFELEFRIVPDPGAV